MDKSKYIEGRSTDADTVKIGIGIVMVNTEAKQTSEIKIKRQDLPSGWPLIRIRMLRTSRVWRGTTEPLPYLRISL